MTPNQRAVFHGHQKVLLYQLTAAEGLVSAYLCKSLGLTEIVTAPNRKRGELKTPALRRHWFLYGDARTFHALSDVADVLLARQEREKKACVLACEAVDYRRADALPLAAISGQTGIQQNSRCDELALAASADEIVAVG